MPVRIAGWTPAVARHRLSDNAVGENDNQAEAYELLETIGPAEPSVSSADRNESVRESAVMRDRNGRFRKGTPSPNPQGAPRKPQLGPWTERMRRVRTIPLKGRPEQISDRELLERVVHNAAMNGDPVALALYEERLAKAMANDEERASRARLDQRIKREQELGIKGASSREALLRDQKMRDAQLDMLRAMVGNLPELQQLLEKMEALSFVDGTWRVADWLEGDEQPPTGR